MWRHWMCIEATSRRPIPKACSSSRRASRLPWPRPGRRPRWACWRRSGILLETRTRRQPRWAWWMTWAGMVGGRWGGDTNALRALVNAPRSLSLDDPAYRAALAPLHPTSGLLEAVPTAIQLAGRTATIREIDALPYVQSEYTRLFRFDPFTNPKLGELRQHYQLDAAVAPGCFSAFAFLVAMVLSTHSSAVFRSAARAAGSSHWISARSRYTRVRPQARS